MCFTSSFGLFSSDTITIIVICVLVAFGLVSIAVTIYCCKRRRGSPGQVVQNAGGNQGKLTLTYTQHKSLLCDYSAHFIYKSFGNLCISPAT